ncbi:DUF4905 domain-containing protein [Parapedobacter lycopersici]|uniref:DUF4905 domain-containing protein n=1 Tax=Parapedobacter lycopersici TaxID=1864939 RepID=UPI00214D2966|nr:DUF4905 domain-containing protein [Parapedobacter lycopersici]
MDKYKLKTAFQKSFLGLIWRIEVDTRSGLMAVETRDVASGGPRFSVFQYASGNAWLEEFPYGDRNWTLAGIVNGLLLLRAYGAQSPDSAGIACINAADGEILWEQFNYTLLAVQGDTLLVRHRNFSAGYEEHLQVTDGTPLRQRPVQLQDMPSGEALRIPQPYTGEYPGFLAHFAIHGDLHYCNTGSYQVWAFHETAGPGYRIRLAVSDISGLIDERIVITGLTKMIPELFFMIGSQIFLIGDNKQEIVSYLL